MPSCDAAMVSGPRRNSAYSAPHQRPAEQRVIDLVQGLHAARPCRSCAAADGPAGCGPRLARRATTGMPSDCSSAPGPMPERCRISHRADRRPAHRITSPLARASNILPFCAEAHARGAPAVEQHACRSAASVSSRRLGRLSTGFRKAARRRPAPAALLVHMEIADAFIVAGVEVGRRGNAHLARPRRARRPESPSARAAAPPAIRHRAP